MSDSEKIQENELNDEILSQQFDSIINHLPDIVTYPYIINPNYFLKDDYSHLSKKEQEANIISIRTEPKIDRNSICSCGSGKKYKKCCLKN